MEWKNLLSGIFPTLNKMQRDTLLLIDLSENLNFEEKNKEYIYLNKGNIKLNNCKQIKLKDFVNLNDKYVLNLSFTNEGGSSSNFQISGAILNSNSQSISLTSNLTSNVSFNFNVYDFKRL